MMFLSSIPYPEIPTPQLSEALKRKTVEQKALNGLTAQLNQSKPISDNLLSSMRVCTCLHPSWLLTFGIGIRGAICLSVPLLGAPKLPQSSIGMIVLPIF